MDIRRGLSGVHCTVLVWGGDPLLGGIQTPVVCDVIVLCVCVCACLWNCLFGRWWELCMAPACATCVSCWISGVLDVCVCGWSSGLWWMCPSLHARAVAAATAACLTFLCVCLWKGGTHYSQTRTHAEQLHTSLLPTQCPLQCPFMPISTSQPSYSSPSVNTAVWFSGLHVDTRRHQASELCLFHSDMKGTMKYVCKQENPADLEYVCVCSVELPAAPQSRSSCTCQPVLTLTSARVQLPAWISHHVSPAWEDHGMKDEVW